MALAGPATAYEIANWARPGHESRHNLVYWRRRAVRRDRTGRARLRRGRRGAGTPRASTATSRRSAAGGACPAGAATTEPEAAAAEAVILALRLDTGIPLSAAHEPPLADQFGWALAAELLDVTEDGRVVLTTRGRLLSNELFQRLI